MRKWLIGLLMILGLYAGFAQAETYVVAIDGTGDFQTLTEAVAASSTGDTILLRAGVYGEQETFPIALDHAVTIEGEDGAVLDSPRFKTMLSVTADGVTLRNIRFQVRKWGIVADVSQAMTVEDCEFVLRRGVPHVLYGDLAARHEGMRNSPLHVPSGRHLYRR